MRLNGPHRSADMQEAERNENRSVRGIRITSDAKFRGLRIETSTRRLPTDRFTQPVQLAFE